MTLKELSQWFWSDDFWLPPNITWDHLVDKSEDPNIRFPSSSDLFYPIPMALVLIVIRYLVENQVSLFTQSQKYMTSLVTYSLLICCCLSDNLTIVFFSYYFYWGVIHKLCQQDFAQNWPPTHSLLTYMKEFLYWNI